MEYFLRIDEVGAWDGTVLEGTSLSFLWTVVCLV